MTNTALLVIDMQKEMEFRTRSGRERANPDAEAHIAELLALFRGRGMPVARSWIPFGTRRLSLNFRVRRGTFAST